MALVLAISRDKRRTAVLSKKRFDPRETSLGEKVRSRQSFTLAAVEALADRLAMAPREVSARLLGLREVEVDIAIRLMNPVNFAMACDVPVYDLLDYFRAGTQPLACFAR